MVLRSWTLVILSLAILCGVSACKKADPNPELKDPLFQSLNAESTAAEAAVKEAEAAVADAEAELKKAVPQTGQNKYAEKRYWEARNRLTLARQKHKALQVKAQMRVWKVKVDSLRAFHADQEWKPGTELDSYNEQALLNKKSKAWSVKERRAALGLPTGRDINSFDPAAAAAKASGSGHGETPPTAESHH